MKKSDLCAARQKMLVPVPEYPGAYALIPPPTPRFIPLPGIQNEVARAHEALGALQALTAKLPNPNLVTRTFDRREAVRSSQIEGTNSGVNDLFLYEATGSDEGLPHDVLVTLNYVKALEHGLKEVRNIGGVNALTCRLIKELHAHLMDGVKDYKGAPGEFREKQNWIGGFKIYQARFVPPPPENVQACMTDLESLLHYAPREEDQFEVPIVIRMAIAHAQFETIHPFIDGNGRVGRILLPLMLAAEGYPPVYLAGFLKDNQQTYYDSLANVQLKEKWTDWVSFFAAGVEVAAQESMRTAQELDAILERWHRDVAGLRLRSDSAVNRLPELLIGNPVLTVRQVKDALGISFPAASGALALLEEKGILVQPVKQQRNRIFVAKEVIDLLDRPSL
jgi:Fic family protein